MNSFGHWQPTGPVGVLAIGDERPTSQNLKVRHALLPFSTFSGADFKIY